MHEYVPKQLAHIAQFVNMYKVYTRDSNGVFIVKGMCHAHCFFFHLHCMVLRSVVVALSFRQHISV